MSTVKDIGPVSAYALAVKYGYTGTEEEWVNEQEAKRKEAVEAANTATTNASTATQAASQAKTYAATATEASGSAAQSEANAKTYAENAAAIAGADIATQDTAGFMKGGDNYVDEAGTLTLTKTTTDRTLLHSHAGGLRIESVAGESVQESTTGAQLLNYEVWKTAKTINGTSVFENNGVTITATVNDAYTFFKSSSNDLYPEEAYIEVAEGDVITLSWEESTNTKGAVYIFGNGNAETSVMKDNATNKSMSYTVPSGVTFVTFRFGVNTAGNTISYKNIMINKGSEALPWEPYTGAAPSPSPSYPQEMESSVVSEINVVGKNIIESHTPSSSTAHGYTALFAEADLKPNTAYVLTFIGNVGNSYFTNETLCTKSVACNVTDGVNALLFTTSANVNKEDKLQYREDLGGWLLLKNSITTNTTHIFEDIQLEEGEEATAYKPYTETTITLSTPITLHGIGEAKDRIVKQDGVWGVERNIVIKRISAEAAYSTADGWTEGAFFTGNFFESGTSSKGYQTVADVMCTHAKVDTPNNIAMNGIVNSIGQGGDGGLALYIRFADCTTKELLVDFLTNNEVYVYYTLAEPTFEPLPAADQIALHSLATYDKVTYISTDSTIEPVIEVEYGTSKVGAEGILNANKLEVSELEKTELEAEIETLKNGHNVLSYSECSQIPGYTSDMTIMEVIDIMPSNSKLQTDYNAGVYPGFTDLPECARTCIGILYIDKTTNSYLVRVFDVDLNKIYMRSAYPEWIEIAPTVLTTTVEETTE